MSNRKFFSGLSEKMMARSTGPNRQQTNFYWPDDSNADDTCSVRSNRLRNRSLSTASVLSQSQASTDTEESRKRRSNDFKSRIEFYDMVDIPTDNESVYSRKLDPSKHKKLETLKSRIEFYDYVDTRDSSQMNDEDTNSVIEVVQKKENQEVRNDKNGTIDTPVENKNFIQNNNKHIDELANNMTKMSMNVEHPKNDMNNHNHKPQYIDSYSESDDEDDYRYQKSFRGQHDAIKRNYPQKNRRPTLPKQHHQPYHQQYQQLPPRRYQSHYFDDFEDDGYDRYFENASIRSSRSRLPRMPRRTYSPDNSDEEFYDNRMYPKRNGRMSRDNRNYEAFSPEREYTRSQNPRNDDYYESYRDDRRQTNNRNTNINGFGSEMDYNRPKSRTPPREQQQHQQSTIEIDSEQNIPTTSARPPIKPVARSMSISGDARRRYHINLKSNIFHTDNEYDQVVNPRKPLSVRDFAATTKIGVGLPDLN
ncbi:putative uncharacterized protein DDB_G0281733 [Chironomus tepperi]|uniref:putative uncharacterized protein DDB_G0281733 n=1 Tax=Chironomus tepperi TaxID=113505 RepID=UPI00391F0355